MADEKSNATAAEGKAPAALATTAGAPSDATLEIIKAHEALTGPEKAMLFVLSLDEPIATRVLALLDEEEVRKLGKVSNQLKEVAPPVIQLVHREFADRAEGKIVDAPSLKGSNAYLRQLTSRVFGESRAFDMWDERSTAERQSIINRFDVKTLAGLLEEEQPQTVAVVLAQIQPAKASDIIKLMPVDRQAQVVLRMAKLQSIPDEVLQEIHEQFAEEAQNIGDGKERMLGGVENATMLLKKLDNETAQKVIGELSGVDTKVAEALRKALFTFEDLMRVDARGMQALLKAISTDQLIIALKTASPAIKEKIFSNLSSRAAGMLREELEMLGPVRISDVEAAQQAIVETALTLEQEGKIQIAREGQSDFV